LIYILEEYDLEWDIGRSKSISNFKSDVLCEVQGSISTFFLLQGPPYDWHLKEKIQIILNFKINMIRNGKKDDQKAF